MRAMPASGYGLSRMEQAPALRLMVDSTQLFIRTAAQLEIEA